VPAIRAFAVHRCARPPRADRVSAALLLLLPPLLGEGLPLSSLATPPSWLEVESQWTFADGSVALACSFAKDRRRL
jgi:hypothetical protein